MIRYFKSIYDYIASSKLLIAVTLSAFLFHMFVIMPSGSWFCHEGKCGVFFWGIHGHDAIWHLALANVAFSQLPFVSPNFSGALLNGYNSLIDLVIHSLSIVGIPAIISYFKLLPIIWFIFLTSLTITFGRKIKDDPLFVTILLFFVYFGSSFTFLITLYHNKTIFDSAGMIAMQSSMHLTNIPFAISLVFLTFILLIIKSHETRRLDFKSVLLLALLIFINLGVKFYAGIISIFIVYVFILIKYLRQGIFKTCNIVELCKYFFVLSLIASAAVVIFYNPFASLKTGSVFIFSPFATAHSIIEEPSLIYLKDMVNARYYLYAHGGLSSPRLWAIELFSSILVLVFSMGFRIFGLLYFFLKFFKKKVNIFEISVFLTVIFAYVLTILFIQKGQWWNTVQFYYFSLYLANIFAAEFFFELIIKAKHYGVFVLLLLFLLTLPGNIDIARVFISFPAHGYLSEREYKALSFLKKQSQGTVYVVPAGKATPREKSKPGNLYEIDSSYVAAFSEHQIYFADEMQLDITGVDYKARREKISRGDCSILSEVQYVYKPGALNDKVTDDCLKNKTYHIEKIYNTEGILIYRIN